MSGISPSATAPAAQINFLGMNQNLYAPFKDKRVREAFCTAVDRNGMTSGLFGGLAEPLYGQMTPGVPGYNKDVKKIAFDAARAKKLLADAGFPDAKGMPPLTITAIASNRDESTYLADQFRRVQAWSDQAAHAMRAQGEHASLEKLLLRPPARFARDYLWKRGFLDGTPGFFIAAMSAFHVFAKYAKLWEMERPGR